MKKEILNTKKEISIKISVLTEILIFIAVSTISILMMPFVSASLECSKAGFCEGAYNLSCKINESDGYCPESYGDWSGCKSNPYTMKCFPCDLDCAILEGKTCGNITISMDDNAAPGGYVTIYSAVYTSGSTSFFVWLKYPDGSAASEMKNCAPPNGINSGCSCTNGVCSVNFYNIFTSSLGGALYKYGVYASIYPYTVWTYGVTKPYVDILQPIQNSVMVDEFDIVTDASSMYNPLQPPQYGPGYTVQGQGGTGKIVMVLGNFLKITGASGGGEVLNIGATNITQLDVFLFRENIGTGVYDNPVNVTNCLTGCTGNSECNLIARWTKTSSGGISRVNNIFTSSWNSSICDNKNFKIEVRADDAYAGSDNFDAVMFALNNSNAPCIENCPKVSTSLLNLVISKIRVWL